MKHKACIRTQRTSKIIVWEQCQCKGKVQVPGFSFINMNMLR